ncbi:MAG: hypothetical protein A2Z14_11945 [Chloroflexi bacterium RBG_16_48_8]|nr:MAG: hypothetical protein A2Z14_11945 [Chloroflexi bacterium RBG_16_48_8]
MAYPQEARTGFHEALRTRKKFSSGIDDFYTPDPSSKAIVLKDIGKIIDLPIWVLIKTNNNFYTSLVGCIPFYVPYFHCFGGSGWYKTIPQPYTTPLSPWRPVIRDF